MKVVKGFCKKKHSCLHVAKMRQTDNNTDTLYLWMLEENNYSLATS